MKIRKLSVQEHGLTRPLYEEVFSEDSKNFVEYYYTEKIRDNVIYVIEEDEDIQTMLHLNPYLFYINGREQVLHYIVAVATRASYRKRGYMGELIRESLMDMYQTGEAFTFLMPAAEAIYLPYDFRTVYEQNRRYYKSGYTGSSKAGELQLEECRELASVANEYLKKNYQVFAVRDGNYYERLKKEYAADGGKIILCRQEGKVVDCCFDIPEEDEESPKIMVRIVNAESMLALLSLNNNIDVCFHITDDVLNENNRCVLLTGTKASGLTITKGKDDNSEGILNISVLTELVFGTCTVEEACKKKEVHMTSRMKEEMGKIIPLTKLCINEIV